MFLALEGKDLLVPCIRRQRFTRILKAPKRISCYLELGNLNFHVPIMCKPICRPQQTTAKTVTGLKLWWLLFIFSTGFRLSHETSSQRISCLVALLETPLDFLSKDFLFTAYFCRLYVLAIFCAGLKTIKISRVTYWKIELKKLTLQFCSESLNYYYDVTKKISHN